MDALSSQASLAGYKAVLDGAGAFTRTLPMMMTAAGTIPAANVFIVGAGVAGLQAIATARRLGAVVRATDVRPEAREQVESVGATFVGIDADAEMQRKSLGGYAAEMSQSYRDAQADLLFGALPGQDIVICTALIPGKQAPLLLSAEMVALMRPGSVIVDMAVDRGGNCALSQRDEMVSVGGVKIVGYSNGAARVPAVASSFYARNLAAFVSAFFDADGTVALAGDDELRTATALTSSGKIVHPRFMGS